MGIERDLANKDHSINIDHTCHNLMNTSRAINLHGGIEKVDPNVSIPETWADFSNRNIQASQSARSSSQRLRGEVDNLITQCANEMWSHWNNTNRPSSRGYRSPQTPTTSSSLTCPRP